MILLHTSFQEEWKNGNVDIYAEYENLDFTNNQNQNNPLEKEYLNWLKS